MHCAVVYYIRIESWIFILLNELLFNTNLIYFQIYPLKNLPYCMTFGHAPILSGVLPSFLKPGSRFTFRFFLLQLWHQLFLEGVLNLITGCWYLQTQIWVLGVLIATHVLLLLCPLSEQARKYMHVTSICTHRKIHIFVCICVYVYVCMYIFKYIDVVPSLSCVWLSETLWTAAGQASLSNHVPEFAQTHVHWVSYAIQTPHFQLSPSLAFNLPKHQGLSLRVGSSHQWPKYWSFNSASVLSMNIQGWFFRIDWFGFLVVQGTLKNLLWKHHFFGPQPCLWSNSHIHIWRLEKP